MNLKDLLQCVVVLSTALLGALSPAYAAEYAVTNIGSIAANDDVVVAQAINDYGQVTGWYRTSNLDQHAFLFDGDIHAINISGGEGSLAFGINNQGNVVGGGLFPGNVTDHAFLYDGGTHDLGTLGGDSTSWVVTSVANGINDSGVVVGSAKTAAGEIHPFLYDTAMHDFALIGGEATAINTAGQVTGYVNLGNVGVAFLYDGNMHLIGNVFGPSSRGQAINSSGQIVGTSNSHGFFYDGQMHELAPLGGTFSSANGINDWGLIVGVTSIDASTTSHAFLYYSSAGVMVDLNDLIDPASGWLLRSATGINNLGQIIGTGTFHGQTRSFLLSPVPEPSALFLSVLGGAALLSVANNRFPRNSTSRRNRTTAGS